MRTISSATGTSTLKTREMDHEATLPENHARHHPPASVAQITPCLAHPSPVAHPIPSGLQIDAEQAL